MPKFPDRVSEADYLPDLPHVDACSESPTWFGEADQMLTALRAEAERVREELSMAFDVVNALRTLALEQRAEIAELHDKIGRLRFEVLG